MSTDPSNTQLEAKLEDWLVVAILLYALIFGVSLVSTGFSAALGDQALALFSFAANPFLGLMVGIIATALIQSSSATTSIIVSLVAGGLPVVMAVPMVMGANIGTSLTNTLVSASYLGDRAEFKRAFAAATVLDMFNLLAVAIFFPLELVAHPLEQLSLICSSYVLGVSASGLEGFNLIAIAVSPVIQLVSHVLSPIPYADAVQVILGLSLVFGAIYTLSRYLKKLLVGNAKALVLNAMGRGSLVGIATGALSTLLVQSSSTTTSLMVPLAGAGVVSLAEIYPFTLGANIGTCITALLAATAIVGSAALPALQIAIVHLLFNSLGVLIIFDLPFLRPIPVWAAERLAHAASQYTFVAALYVASVFFVVPGLGLLFFHYSANFSF